MYLKELDLGHEVKCACDSCDATGIYKGYAERDDLGVICHDCNGKGYYILELSEHNQLVQDEKTGTVYKVKDDLITDSVVLFNGLKTRDDVNYVMYETGRFLSSEYLFKNGASEIEVIKYEDFLQGNLPLPMPKYTCPRFLSQLYGKAKFYNDCRIGALVSECDKFEIDECWDKFYGEAKTIEEKQNVLRKIR